MPPEAPLAVTFTEPKFQEPTVGGVTGQQLLLLRELQVENHCWYEVYPVSPKGPAEYCIEPREDWSSYCEQHAYQVAQEQPAGPTYDEYDFHRDLEFENSMGDHRDREYE